MLQSDESQVCYWSAADLRLRSDPAGEARERPQLNLTMNVHTLAFAAAALTASVAASEPVRPEIYDVRNYGAKGDGKSDDTAAFQHALDLAGEAGGGVVHAPRGNYLFAHHLSVPNGVTLEGIWAS